MNKQINFFYFKKQMNYYSDKYKNNLLYQQSFNNDLLRGIS